MVKPWESPVGLMGRLMLMVAAVWMVGAAAPAAAQGAAPRSVTFTKDIAPILQRSCQRCHRPGSVAPMSLLTYEDARPYARAMKQRTALRHAPWSRGAMPPWYLERNIGIQTFKDDISLSDEEIALFAAWADSGAPEGNPADLPPPLKFAGDAEWTLGKPDLIVSSPRVFVPAVASDWTADIGTVPTGLTEDRFMSSVEYKEVAETDLRGKAGSSLGGRFVFHHMVVRIRAEGDTDEGSSARGDTNSASSDAVSLPIHEVGRNGDVFPADAGIPLKARSSFGFNAHIHASGTDRNAHFEVGVRLHPKAYEPRYRVRGASFLSTEIQVNPLEGNQRIDAYWVAPEPIKLMNYEPHMHAAGVRMCIEAIVGRVVETLNCAGYDHNWVRNYQYEDTSAPLLPKGTILHAIGWFDNTPKNTNILDPRNLSRFGNSSVANMFIVFNKAVFLTEAQYQEELAKRREHLRLTREEVIGCPDCYKQPAPPNYLLPAPNPASR